MEFKDIKQDKRNYRIHDDRNKDLIRKSIDECGLGRSILVDSEGYIIGGNGIVSQLPENTPIKVIETKGDELVVVKRVDLSSEDEKRKKLAIMDNSTSDSSKFDIELLTNDFEIPELEDIGIDLKTIEDCETSFPEIETGDRKPFQQITFTLADGQAELIKQAIATAKKDKNYDFVESMGNENSNGNALFMIVQEWLNGRR